VVRDGLDVTFESSLIGRISPKHNPTMASETLAGLKMSFGNAALLKMGRRRLRLALLVTVTSLLPFCCCRSGVTRCWRNVLRACGSRAGSMAMCRSECAIAKHRLQGPRAFHLTVNFEVTIGDSLIKISTGTPVFKIRFGRVARSTVYP
jgi:hypothetical protein